MISKVTDVVKEQVTEALSISHAHAEQAGDLPRHHGDPFDRMLIAQSQMEGLTLISADTAFTPYGIRLMNART